MSDPTRAPAGWYEDGSGARRYWDGDAWTQYVAPGSEALPASQGDPDTAVTAVLPAGDDGPTIPFVWGSRGSDAAGSGYGGGPTGSAGWGDPSAPQAAAGVNREAPTESYGAPATTVLPRHPLTEPPYPEPANPGPPVVGIIALVVAIAGLAVVFTPAVSGFAWILVPVAFVLSIIGLFLRGAKWPAVTGLLVSIAAAVVGIVMLVVFVIGSIGSAIDGIDEAIPDVPGLPLPGPDDAGPGPDAGQPGQPGAPGGGTATLAFGETMTWDDGVALTVSAPEPYTPSAFAVGATRANNVVFTFTLTNNSTADLQALPLPTFSSGDQEVSQIVDLGNDPLGPGDDVGFPPATTVEPGGSISWRVAWSVDDPSALTLQVAPSFLYPNATFTNVS
jgi:hypothetical protein